MEKFVVATNVKVSNHIPDDLAFFILSKLSIKSLYRFGCVRKAWTLLFENPQFMIMYRNYFLYNNHSYYDGASILLSHCLVPSGEPGEQNELLYSTLYLLSGDRFENRVKLDWPPPFHEDDSFIDILSSVCVNGTLCLTQGSNLDAKCVFWNPTTDEFKVIPPSPFEYIRYHDTMKTFHGFGYDHVKDDYKVIRRLDFFVDSQVDQPYEADEPYEADVGFPSMWEIYSLRSNSWRKLDVDMPFCSRYDGVYMDGFCHWSGEDDYLSLSKVGPCLVSFDLCNEVFLTTPLPSDMVDDCDILRMVLLNGSIAFIIYDESTTFHIRILGELGVKESWANVFIVKPLPCAQHLIGVGEKGGIFLRKNDDELVWYDMSTQTIEELGVKISRGYCNIVVYKDSLLPIVGL
ncbi:F-box protein CPR1-like [Cicer arietinum]|uniref:F-box protein At3g16210 n=1 Tax=Cicer arietinum TaxID=3827 RepID=A0A1S2Z4U5_CICAR|nr:putative F-box protein At3g16210 [Cicer arietinum]